MSFLNCSCSGIFLNYGLESGHKYRRSCIFDRELMEQMRTDNNSPAIHRWTFFNTTLKINRFNGFIAIAGKYTSEPFCR
jgi:hypothetical protein